MKHPRAAWRSLISRGVLVTSAPQPGAQLRLYVSAATDVGERMPCHTRLRLPDMRVIHSQHNHADRTWPGKACIVTPFAVETSATHLHLICAHHFCEKPDYRNGLTKPPGVAEGTPRNMREAGTTTHTLIPGLDSKTPDTHQEALAGEGINLA